MDERIISQRIKDLRTQRNLTLSDLAKSTGFSKGLLSKIENNQVSPPIATLSTISKALGVRIGYFFKEDESGKRTAVFTKEYKGIPVVQDGTKFGYTYEALAMDKVDKLMEPFLLTVKHGDEANYFQHKGDEFIYMVKGKMRFEIGSENYILEEGDSLYFDSSIPHKPIVLNEGEAKFIAIFCRE